MSGQVIRTTSPVKPGEARRPERRADLVRWSTILLLAIVLSTFLHEAGHGASASVRGFPVSTGFNKVGDFGRRPGDPDFRSNLAGYRNPWDLGPAVTLTLAVVSTLVLYRVRGTLPVMAAGALALANSMLRLIPMVLAWFTLLTTGSLSAEDEIVQGRIWYELTGVMSLRYLPFLVSVAVSLLCLRYVLRGLRARLPGVLTARRLALTSLMAFLASLPVLSLLDRYLRINWP